jgi:hypothetical protein
MLGTAVLSIFIFIIILIIFLEYKNERQYQEKRRQGRPRPTKDERSTQTKTLEKAPPKTEPRRKVEPKPEPKPEPKIDVKPELKPEPKIEIKPEPKPEPKIDIIPEPVIQKEEPKETKELPQANYPEFTHVRLVEMGLSDEEAKEFVAELIPQIEVEIPLIQAAIESEDFHKMERLTHGIKGSATNLGTGGVSDLLVDYNTYLKSGSDIDIAKAYLKHLIDYTNELKAQYA